MLVCWLLWGTSRKHVVCLASQTLTKQASKSASPIWKTRYEMVARKTSYWWVFKALCHIRSLSFSLLAVLAVVFSFHCYCRNPYKLKEVNSIYFLPHLFDELCLHVHYTMAMYLILFTIHAFLRFRGFRRNIYTFSSLGHRRTWLHKTGRVWWQAENCWWFEKSSGYLWERGKCVV